LARQRNSANALSQFLGVWCYANYEKILIAKKKVEKGQKSCLVVSKLDSQLEGRGFESHPKL